MGATESEGMESQEMESKFTSKFTSTKDSLLVGGVTVEFNRMAGAYIKRSGSDHYEVRIQYLPGETVNFLGRKIESIKQVIVPDLDKNYATGLFALLRAHKVSVANLTPETAFEP
jgi:hypothetical protein